MKSKVNSFLASIGYRVTRVHSEEADLFHALCSFNSKDADSLERAFLKHCMAHSADSKAQRFQDLMADFFSLGQAGTFCEFGATDGISLSNSWFLEAKRGWTGILAEPGRNWHAALHKNRPNATIETKCVYSLSGQTIRFSEAVDGVYSAISDLAGKDAHTAHRAGSLEYDVQTIALNDLLQAHGIGSLDFLSVDTEGSEFKILKAFDFRMFKPKIIAVEHNYTESRTQLYDMLSGHGFIRVFEELSAFDDWYVEPQCLERATAFYC